MVRYAGYNIIVSSVTLCFCSAGMLACVARVRARVCVCLWIVLAVVRASYILR